MVQVSPTCLVGHVTAVAVPVHVGTLLQGSALIGLTSRLLLPRLFVRILQHLLRFLLDLHPVLLQRPLVALLAPAVTKIVVAFVAPVKSTDQIALMTATILDLKVVVMEVVVDTNGLPGLLPELPL